MQIKIKKIFAGVFCILLLIFSEAFFSRSFADEEIDGLGMRSYVLVEASTGYVVRGLNENEKVPMGAVNKLMTALIAVEKLNEGFYGYDTELTASLNAHNAGGAVIWLDANEKIKVSELFKGLLIGNANDAAIVFAETISGDTEKFVALMNERATELGMKNTKFTSCANHDDENQYTTAHDTALLCAELIRYEELHEIMTTRLEYIRDNKTELVNENTLVNRYDGITGMKASHTEKSGYSVIASAKRNDESYIAVVLGCDNSDDRFTAAKKLLDKGFLLYKTVIPGFSEEYMKPLRVKRGTESAVEVKVEKFPLLVIPKSHESDLTVVVFLPEYIKAPVSEGQYVGEVAFYCDETLLYETPLITKKAVLENTFLKSLLKLMGKMFK
ncbi:MAG: D-alanyl-D-alanine carboxypeptidase [Ruminococcus sp.]|nr:D-alanyl-D-alanine carboxypeptidase [Ruminococcus sp.]